jgi:hypothetical protein
MMRKSFWRALRQTERWRDRWGMVKSVFWWCPVMRLDNRWRDLRARLAGACNASTWTGEPPIGYAGGYSHWRCGKRRGHRDTKERMDSAHRFNNYVWDGDGRVEFAPIDIGGLNDPVWDEILPFAKQTSRRRAIDTRRHSRLRAKWEEELMEARRLQRRERKAEDVPSV